MANVKITDMTPDSSIGGSEIMAVSDAGSPKSITTGGLKQYVIDAIEALSAGSSTSGSDSIFILQSGVLKPLDIDTIAQYVIDIVWGKTAETSPDDADVLPLKDGGTTEKTVTAAVFAEYVRGAIEADILNLADLSDGSGALDSTDYMLVTQGGVGKRIQVSDLSTAIYAALATYVDSLTAASAADGTEKVYCIQGGLERELTLSQIKTYVGVSASAPGSTTVNNIPQWSTTGGALKDGLSLDTAISAVGDNDSIPTTKAVDDRFNAVDYLFVPASAMWASTTNGCDTGQYETTTNKNNFKVMLFDGLAANEIAEFDVIFPDAWNLGTLKAKVIWAPASNLANVNEWVGFLLSGRCFPNDAPLDVAMGTASEINDQVLADWEDMHVSPASEALTLGGTPTRGGPVHFKLERDYDYNAGTGTAMDLDAQVLGVLFQFTRGAAGTAW